MGLPHSAFYNYAKASAFFAIGGQIYPIRSKDVRSGNGIIEVQSRPVSLEMLEGIYLSDLEREDKLRGSVQSKKNRSEHSGLARFVIENVLGGKSCDAGTSDGCIITKLMPKEGILVKYGLCYDICSDANGAVKVNGTRYRASKNPYKVDDIEERYLDKIKESISGPEGISLNGHYDREKGIGFLVDGGDFYVYAEVGPYALYERDDRTYYRFSKAKVGSMLTLNEGRIGWNRLVVIDSYTHPSLPEKDRPYQTICVGDFDYESIREKYPGDTAQQIVELMRKGKKALTAEYTGQGRPWHRLTDAIFSENRIIGRQGVTALNY